MVTITAWFLIISSSQNGLVSYSPPFATQAECQRIQQTLPKTLYGTKICQEMTVVRPGW
jgi:hypothetical protein